MKNGTKILDLATEAGCKEYNRLKEEVSFKCCPLSDYLERGVKANVVYGKTQIFGDNRGSFGAFLSYLLKDQKIFICEHSLFPDSIGDSEWDKEKCLEVPSAIVLDYLKQTTDLKHPVLVNGDEEGSDHGPEYTMVGDDSVKGMPTTSFACLQNFYSTKDTAISRLASGKLRVIDYTLDETKQLTARQRDINHDEQKKLKPPEAGFTLVSDEWHRSGSVLLWDAEKKLCILQGQDEDTYFGVELPKKVKTVSQAFEILVPKEVVGLRCIRQGEWFIVNVSQKEVPAKKDAVALFATANTDASEEDNVFLPIETEDSHRHAIATEDGRFSKDGRIFAYNPTLTHEQHYSVSKDGWCTFYKNTAIRSFSQEGVD